MPQRRLQHWGLSTGRANGAAGQCRTAVSARSRSPRYAARPTWVRKPKQPEDPSNRRISLIVQYTAIPEPDEKDSKAPAKEAGKNAAREPEKKH